MVENSDKKVTCWGQRVTIATSLEGFFYCLKHEGQHLWRALYTWHG